MTYRLSLYCGALNLARIKNLCFKTYIPLSICKYREVWLKVWVRWTSQGVRRTLDNSGGIYSRDPEEKRRKDDENRKRIWICGERSQSLSSRVYLKGRIKQVSWRRQDDEKYKRKKVFSSFVMSYFSVHRSLTLFPRLKKRLTAGTRRTKLGLATLSDNGCLFSFFSFFVFFYFLILLWEIHFVIDN